MVRSGEPPDPRRHFDTDAVAFLAPPVDPADIEIHSTSATRNSIRDGKHLASVRRVAQYFCASRGVLYLLRDAATGRPGPRARNARPLIAAFGLFVRHTALRLLRAPNASSKSCICGWSTAPQPGRAWFNGLERAILSLEQLPKRFRITPESFDPDQPVRVLNYGRRPYVYRVFFTIDKAATVVQVHIRRGARQRPAPGDLTGG
jgi:hypothetical protein